MAMTTRPAFEEMTPALKRSYQENNHRFGDYVTALDACQICGRVGYRQEGQNVICRNCGASIYIPSIGTAGGCNQIPVKSSVAGGEVIVGKIQRPVQINTDIFDESCQILSGRNGADRPGQDVVEE